MTDQPKWLPSDEEIAVAASYLAQRHDPTFGPLRALIRAAVEKALAEQREARALDVDLAKMCAERLAEELRVLRLMIQSDKAQRRREVIEARIYECEEYGDCICERYSDPTLNVRHRDCEVCKHLDSLRAELAALDKEVKP